MERPNPKTFVGTGKIEEIHQYVKENEISTLIFDDELSPSQQKISKVIVECKILDRTHLILDIFAQRAETSYRTQVGTMPILTTKAFWNVDTRASKGEWNAWTWGNRN
jgi:GTP-binding protein HflX